MIKKILFSCIVILTFIGCDEDETNGPVTVTVNGTLTLPSPANGHDWGVLIDNDLDGDNGYLYITTGTAGPSAIINYTITNVNAGTYYIYAVVCQQSQCQGGPQSGDFVGIYGGTYANQPSSPNANISTSSTTFDITLEVLP